MQELIHLLKRVPVSLYTRSPWYYLVAGVIQRHIHFIRYIFWWLPNWKAARCCVFDTCCLVGEWHCLFIVMTDGFSAKVTFLTAFCSAAR